jgi:hypothetical protein
MTTAEALARSSISSTEMERKNDEYKHNFN